MYRHIIQSKEWANFKRQYGTKVITVGDVNYTIHYIPKTKFAYAYCPKINPHEVNWDKLINSVREQNCFAIKIDVPNVMEGTKEQREAQNIFDTRKGFQKSSKNTFTKNNVIINLDQKVEELWNNLHPKHRYNIKYAQKHGVTLREATNENDYNIFFDLMSATAKRQHFLIHPNSYYKSIWELFHPQGLAHILIAEYEGKPLAAWMLFTYQDVLYYPYGASSDELRNLQASNFIGWEAIQFGKKMGCHIFDMWGACKDINNTKDPEWGFTNFKLKFGGKLVTYMDSYDFVIDRKIYNAFNFIYPKAIWILKKLT